VVGAPPKCSEHKLALEFVRVEISRQSRHRHLPLPLCGMQDGARQPAAAPHGGAWKVGEDGTYCTADTL
jgi:hypothetical protein